MAILAGQPRYYLDHLSTRGDYKMSNGTIKVDANSTKSPARPSHEALEHTEGQSKIDRVAEESAQRASNRI